MHSLGRHARYLVLVQALMQAFAALISSRLSSAAALQAAIGPMSIPALLIASGVSSQQPVPTGQEYIDTVMGITLLCGLLMFTLGVLNMVRRHVKYGSARPGMDFVV
jgi:MFS superfamily sulfate permease-like transporter